MVGVEFQASWYGRFTPNMTGRVPEDYRDPEDCRAAPCLFDVMKDPGEHFNLARQQPARVAAMMARFKALEADYHPARVGPAVEAAKFCAAVRSHKGFVAPFMAASEGL